MPGDVAREPVVVDAIRAIVRDESMEEPVRALAVYRLADSGDDLSVDLVLEQIERVESGEVRAAAIRALSGTEHPLAADPLLDILRDPSADPRERSFAALGMRGHTERPDVTEELIRRATEERDHGVRVGIVGSLAAHARDSLRATSRLVDVLESEPSSRIRLQASVGLTIGFFDPDLYDAVRVLREHEHDPKVAVLLDRVLDRWEDALRGD